MAENDVAEVDDGALVDVALRVARTGVDGDVVTLDDVERAIWTLTGWERPQPLVDGVLAVVRAYAAGVVVRAALDRTTLVELATPSEPEPAAVSDAVTGDGESFTCIECKVAKPVSEYHRDSATARGHKPRCRDCTAARRRARGSR